MITYNDGDEFSADWLNKLMAAIDAAIIKTDQSTILVDSTSVGQTVRLNLPQVVNARIVSGSNPYYWIEEWETPYGAWEDQPEGRTDAGGTDAVYERNGNPTIKPGAIVRAVRDVHSGKLIFDRLGCSAGTITTIPIPTPDPTPPVPTPAPTPSPTPPSPVPTPTPLAPVVALADSTSLPPFSPDFTPLFSGSAIPLPTGADSIQTISANAVYPGSDTWSITWATHHSGAIRFDADGPGAQTTIQAITGIGAGNVSVTGPAYGPWVVEFTGTLAHQAISAFTAYIISAGDSITITQTQIGHP